MSSVSIKDAQAHLSQVIAGLRPGEPLLLVENGEPVATLTRVPRTSWPCQPGTARDRAFWMAPDFDAPLEEFAEYME